MIIKETKFVGAKEWIQLARYASVKIITNHTANLSCI